MIENTRPKTSFMPLLFAWGVLGAMFGCGVLWVTVAIAGETLEAVMQWSRDLLAHVGISVGERSEILLLHLQFGGLGFIAGCLFRYRGLRRQLG